MLLIVMLGAAAGAPSRWLLDQYVQARHDDDFPWGTLVINVIGSLILGLLLAAMGQGAVTPEVLALVGVGFCGGFTTFSTFSYESVRLAQEGAALRSLANIGLSLGIGLAASVLGWLLGHALLG